MSGESITYMVLSGAAILLSLVAATYLITLIMDRFCSARVDPERIYTPVSNKANLWGLRPEERRAVLEKAFSTYSSQYQRPETTSTSNGTVDCDCDISAVVTHNISHTAEDPEPVSPQSPPSPGSHKDEEEHSETYHSGKEEPLVEVEVSTKEQTLNEGALLVELSEDSLLRTCAICLAEYETGDNVMAGVSCKHCLYHRDCIMQWMQNGHDYCPYCRKEMLTASDMRNAALEVLGQKRVHEVSLSRSNWWRQPSSPTGTANQTDNQDDSRQEQPAAAEIQMTQLGGNATRGQLRNSGGAAAGTEVEFEV